MMVCNEVDNLVNEPGVTGHKSELMNEPRFTRNVTGLFICPRRFLAAMRRTKAARAA